jgi:hypothetical protein
VIVGERVNFGTSPFSVPNPELRTPNTLNE